MEVEQKKSSVWAVLITILVMTLLFAMACFLIGDLYLADYYEDKYAEENEAENASIQDMAYSDGYEQGETDARSAYDEELSLLPPMGWRELYWTHHVDAYPCTCHNCGKQFTEPEMVEVNFDGLNLYYCKYCILDYVDEQLVKDNLTQEELDQMQWFDDWIHGRLD